MYYHPGWHRDQKFFLKLLKQKQINDQDIIKLARLYIKYNNIHSCSKKELNQYFVLIFQKISVANYKELYSKTQKIYHNKSNLFL